MLIKRIALVLMLIIVSMSVVACHRRTPPPPYDAKVISETQINDTQRDTTETIKSEPPAGGGTQLNEKQW